MVKVLMERTIRGQNVGQIVRLLRQLRVLAMQQPGYISGETLHGVDDPNYYLVISTWESLGQWQDWFNNPERQKLSAEIDSYLESRHPDPGYDQLRRAAPGTSPVDCRLTVGAGSRTRPYRCMADNSRYSSPVPAV